MTWFVAKIHEILMCVSSRFAEFQMNFFIFALSIILFFTTVTYKQILPVYISV